ncbi:MAG: hypothetical protein IJV22_01680 [Bacteroidales bacterium]|nr:hypothetical protein [Bacteroidales bacterium]
MATSTTIVEKLDLFIRKYYKNQLVRGVLYAVALLATLFLLIALSEHFGYFGTRVRTLLFWLFVAVVLVVIALWVLRPLLKMHKLGKRISYEEAARIVGRHFPEVSDKLLNLLQLQSMGEGDDALLQAAVQQKTDMLRPIPFVGAIDLRGNLKYVKYAAVPVAIVLILWLAAPRTIRDSSQRLIHHTTVYERPAPFYFVVDTSALRVVRGESCELHVRLEGSALPDEVYVAEGGRMHKMHSAERRQFTHLFKSMRESVEFRLEAAGVQSRTYRIEVVPKPAVAHYAVALRYPAYTGKPSETLSDVGDLLVPEGTVLTWSFQTQYADSLYFTVDSVRAAFALDESGRLAVSRRAMSTMAYSFYVGNSFVPQCDTLSYVVSVVPDAAPMIAVAELRDSLTPNRIYFKGRVKDDYGFSRLEMKLQVMRGGDTVAGRSEVRSIGLEAEASQEFYYTLNLNELHLVAGENLVYYFEVWDNDGVHGPKSARSQQFELHIPTAEELDNRLEDNRRDIADKAASSMSELRKIQQDISDMMRQLVDKKQLDWQDKRQLEELAKKQQQVKQQLERMQQQISENNRLEQHYREQSEQLLEKQRELDKLMNEVMSDEMKDLMRQMEQMMQQLDKNQVQQQLENLKMKNEDLEKQLDQNIALMKQLEVEKKVEETVHRAEKLAEEQQKLAEQTREAKGADREQLDSKQQELNQEFRQLKEELDKIQKDYKAIDPSLDFKRNKDLENSISQKQQEAQQQLQKGKNSKAADKQQEASEDLQQLAQDIADAQESIEQQQTGEDAEQVRHLLKDLVQLSFRQEEQIGLLNTIYIQDPKYQSIIAEQNKIRTDFRMVEDSLRSIARRQMTVASVVNRELTDVKENLSGTMTELLQYNQTFYGNYKNTSATRTMQYSMTSLNNLALVLAESLDKMQNSMRQQSQKQKSGSKNQRKQGSCNNPGGGKPSAKLMKQMQDELNRQLQSLKQQLDKQGSQPQRTRLGQGQSMSEEFARMAAQQEQIRRMMQQYGQEMKQNNAGNAKLAREIETMMRQMEETETDLVNRTITAQTIQRQRQILTRMLEHEKAEMQQEKDERRKSEEGKELYQPSQGDLDAFERMQQKNVEQLRTAPPSLTPFFKEKVNSYFYREGR